MRSQDDASIEGQGRAASDALWADVSAELGLIDSAIIGRNHIARRVYRVDGNICKIQLKTPDVTADSVPWHGSVANEFRIAQSCQGIPQVPQAIRYWETPRYEAALYTACRGARLRDIPPSLLHNVTVLWQLALILWRLSWRGIAHNDVREGNILVDRDGERPQASLIDFDRALTVSRTAAFHRNFIRLKRGGGRSFHGSWIRLAVWQLSPGAGRMLRRWKQHVRRSP